MDWEPVIGLETHAELLTESKLWCPCSTQFGRNANSQTCPVCLGMPGSLPVLNVRAMELALRAAVALRCTINRRTFFDRKNYYYPDLPKNYQISQNYCNLGVDGSLDIPSNGGARRIGILNVHLEEDAGKNLHAEAPGADYSLVDLNRAGIPLLEIVSAPDMHSAEETDSYMQTLRQVLLYTQVSSGKMQEGALRFEASISMRPAGTQELGARVEIKNLNSTKAVRLVLEYEMRRQGALLKEGKPVQRETRLWDEVRERSGRMRSKEEAQDYRYFPEPDLLPFEIDEEMMSRAAARVPELPLERRRRFSSTLGLSEYDASVLTDERAVADFFEDCVKQYPAPKSLANVILNVMLGQLSERGTSISQVQPKYVADVVRMMDDGKITARVAQELLAREIERVSRPIVGEGSGATQRQAPGDASGSVEVGKLIEQLGLQQISDESALEPVVEQVIRDNPKAVQDYLAGKAQALGPLVGEVMRRTRGKSDPRLVNKMLRERLDAKG